MLVQRIILKVENARANGNTLNKTEIDKPKPSTYTQEEK